MKEQERINKALELAMAYGGIDGAHHKSWVIDQMVRALTGCRFGTFPSTDSDGDFYQNEIRGETLAYQGFVEEACYGEDGPDTYTWDIGIPP